MVYRKKRDSEQIKLTVYKVPGEINTDDLSQQPMHGLDQIFPCMPWQCLKCQEKV